MLNIEIAGPSAPEFDRLAISAPAVLGGTVNVARLGGYAPADGTSFAFLTANSLSGSFASVTGGFSAEYTANSASLVAGMLEFATLGEWTEFYFDDPDSLDAQPGADPNRNGIPNLMEYALNRDPHSPDRSGMPAAERIGDLLRFKFTRIYPADIDYLIQAMGEDGEWDTVAVLPAGQNQWVIPGTGRPAPVAESGTGRARIAVWTEDASQSDRRLLRLGAAIP
ncbi:MAG: hypothetical protein R3F11_13435 [Verrucomicrobiales bacterium]